MMGVVWNEARAISDMCCIQSLRRMSVTQSQPLSYSQLSPQPLTCWVREHSGPISHRVSLWQGPSPHQNLETGTVSGTYLVDGHRLFPSGVLKINNHIKKQTKWEISHKNPKTGACGCSRGVLLLSVGHVTSTSPTASALVPIWASAWLVWASDSVQTSQLGSAAAWGGGSSPARDRPEPLCV